jgi:hypothetical protein
MKRIIAATLALALITPALPAFAADSPAETSETAVVRQSAPVVPAITMSLRESAKQAAAQVGPRSLPRQPNEGARMQGGGGGKTGMIIGLVSAAAGIGLTVYMVKYMKKTTDAASRTN